MFDTANTPLKFVADVVIWKFGGKGHFTVKSVYNALTSNDNGLYEKKIWKGKIPAKIKIFLWMVLNNAILTNYNMIKRNWSGDPACYFCPIDETATHLFFQCSVTRAVWATIATCIGANNIPQFLNQSWAWCESWLPGEKKFHTLGIAAICRAI